MPNWPRHPSIIEINTWVWLTGLRKKYGIALTLACVPQPEWDALATFGFDAVWLMGVWERSPAGISIANRNTGLLDDFRRALPDFRLTDNVGSAYSVRRYEVDRHLGGARGLQIAREELAKRGMRLLLDFVPNHVATDHPWVIEHPEYFIRGNADDGASLFAYGRDPNFPPWLDVLQLNAWHPGLRSAARGTVLEIARQCDGVRCDMAMLLLNSVFERTWGSRAGQSPATEYWTDLIPAVKAAHPDFLFIAEAYWDREWELQQQGFDFCYDKRLYDRLEMGDAEGVRLHLCADLQYQEKLVRFIENHDEPRAAAAFSPAKERAAAVTVATLPGARLFHEGQLDGRKVRLPVFLDRRPDEPPDEELRSFYTALLETIKRPVFRDGRWNLCQCTGWTDNPSFHNLVSWSWISQDDRYLIVVNLSDRAAQGRVLIPWRDIRGEAWRLTDSLSGASYDRTGNELYDAGLHVELRPWGLHFLQFRQLAVNEVAAAAQPQ